MEDTVQMDRNETVREVVDWIDVAEDGTRRGLV